MANFRPVVFNIGGEKYGVYIGDVRGIERMQEISRIPNSSRHIKGIINLRGDVIPVFSIRSKFGLEEIEPTLETRLIIVQSGDFLLALEVDSVEEIQNVDVEMVHDAPIIIKNQETEYVKKVVSVNGKLIIVIDPINVLLPSEREAIKDLLQDSETEEE
ncbi:MAG: chemotaxis protein CheW [Lachnospiraceae bacterium]|nr:chemotaxis protein CheW [Lachnospiraceae bacterium]